MSQNEFLFNNVGENIDLFRQKNKNDNNIFNKRRKSLPVGIKLPLQKGNKTNESLCKMNFNVLDQINDNLRFLLNTRKGEKLRDYNFGTNLTSVFNLTNLNDEDLENTVVEEIRSAVNSYMSPTTINNRSYFVNLETFSMNKKRNNLNDQTIFEISVDYRVSGISRNEIDILSNSYQGLNNNIDSLISDIQNLTIKFKTSR